MINKKKLFKCYIVIYMNIKNVNNLFHSAAKLGKTLFMARTERLHKICGTV